MVWDNKAYSDTLTAYKKGKSWLNDVTVEIEGGAAEADPMFLLRIYDDSPSVDNQHSLATAFCLSKRVVFRDKGGAEIHSFVYTGGDLAEKFVNCPYLLDVLHQASYAIMIKKLTPPSSDSQKEERQSE